MPNKTIHIDPDPREVHKARKLVESTLESSTTKEDIYRATLLVSEIVTNSVHHAKTPVVVNIRFVDSCLCVSVHDRNPSLPTPKEVASDATSGRGLSIVDSFASSWGTTSTTDGKLVWFCLQVHRVDQEDQDANTCDKAGICDSMSILYSEDTANINKALNFYREAILIALKDDGVTPSNVKEAVNTLNNLSLLPSNSTTKDVLFLKSPSERKPLLLKVESAVKVLEKEIFPSVMNAEDISLCISLRNIFFSKLLSNTTPKSPESKNS